MQRADDSTTRLPAHRGVLASLVERAPWVFLAAWAGCVQLPPERARSSDCVLHSDVEEEFSAAVPEACTLLRASLDEDLGLTRTDPRPIQMGVYRDRGALASICGSALACAGPFVTASHAPLHVHELVHAHLGFARPPLLFIEGLATLYECQPAVGAVAHALPVGWLTDDGAFRAGSGSYVLASAFVAHLIERFGPRVFGRFYVEAVGGRDLATLDAVAVETLGEPISEVLAAWAALPPPPPEGLCRPLFPCSAPLREVGEHVLSLSRGLVDANQFGAQPPEEPPSFHRGGAVFTLDAREPMTVTVSAPEVTVLVGRCDVPAEWGELSAPSGTAELALDAGRWFVWVSGSIASPDEPSVGATLTVR